MDEYCSQGSSLSLIRFVIINQPHACAYFKQKKAWKLNFLWVIYGAITWNRTSARLNIVYQLIFLPKICNPYFCAEDMENHQLSVLPKQPGIRMENYPLCTKSPRQKKSGWREYILYAQHNIYNQGCHTQEDSWEICRLDL